MSDGSVIRFVPKSMSSCSGAAALSASTNGGVVSGMTTSFELEGGVDYSDDSVHHICFAQTPSTPLVDSDFNHLKHASITILHAPPSAPPPPPPLPPLKPPSLPPLPPPLPPSLPPSPAPPNGGYPFAPPSPPPASPTHPPPSQRPSLPPFPPQPPLHPPLAPHSHTAQGFWFSFALPKTDTAFKLQEQAHPTTLTLANDWVIPVLRNLIKYVGLTCTQPAIEHRRPEPRAAHASPFSKALGIAYHVRRWAEHLRV